MFDIEVEDSATEDWSINKEEEDHFSDDFVYSSFRLDIFEAEEDRKTFGDFNFYTAFDIADTASHENVDFSSLDYALINFGDSRIIIIFK
jgi:hypothetical protein